MRIQHWSSHPVRSRWGRPGCPTPQQRPSRWAPGRCGGVWSVCGGLRPCLHWGLCQPALPHPPAGSMGYCLGPSALDMPQKISIATTLDNHFLFFFCSSFNADWLIKNPYCGYPSIVDFNCKDISTVWCWLIQACYSVHFYISPHLQLISLRLSSELSLLHHVRGTRLKYKKHLQAAVKQGHLKSHEICFLIGLQVEIQLLPVCFEKLDQRGPNFSNFHITVLLQLLYLKQNILYY